MKNHPIRVLVVDDSAETRTSLRKLLQFEEDILVIGEAQDGEEAILEASRLEPDCILMDINMPGTDGIKATATIHSLLPQILIVMMSVQGEQEYLRKAMFAGARDFLTKPFSGDELVHTLRQLCEGEQKKKSLLVQKDPRPIKEAKVLVVYGAKGGVGKSTIATNLSVALAEQGNSVVLMDLDLQFGDTEILLNVSSSRTIGDFAQESGEEAWAYLTEYGSNLRLLAAPRHPEESELVTDILVRDLVNQLRIGVDFLVIDTPPILDDRVLMSFELANEILLVANPDVPNLKNLQRLMDLLDKLTFSHKLRVVLNKCDSGHGLSLGDVTGHLPCSLWHTIPADPSLVVMAANTGEPFVKTHPKARVSQRFYQIGQKLLGKGHEDKPKQRLRFWR